MKCDYCGSDGECEDWCQCSKCVDPEGYEAWKDDCPEEYDKWLERKLDEEESE